MAGGDRAGINPDGEMVMNRLRDLWNALWVSALIIAMLIGMVGAIVQLAVAWATAP